MLSLSAEISQQEVDLQVINGRGDGGVPFGSPDTGKPFCHCAKGIYSAGAGEIIAAYDSSQSNLLSQATQNNYTKQIKKGAYLSDTHLGKRAFLLIVSYVQEPSAPVHYCTCLVQMSKIEEMYTFMHK